jgi:hypothetical protein
VLITTPLNVSLRGTVTKVISVQLTNSEDTFIGKLHRSGFFTVSSMYMWKIQEGVVPNKSPLWNLKVPLKIKIFLWYLLKGVRLTKDNIAKRNWHGSIKCWYCSSIETIQHIFCDCHFSKFIWTTVHITFGIQPPFSIKNMFGTWLLVIQPKLKKQILFGAATIC